jgi:hypothetical protein
MELDEIKTRKTRSLLTEKSKVRASVSQQTVQARAREIEIRGGENRIVDGVSRVAQEQDPALDGKGGTDQVKVF